MREKTRWRNRRGGERVRRDNAYFCSCYKLYNIWNLCLIRNIKRVRRDDAYYHVLKKKKTIFNVLDNLLFLWNEI